jgi:predicted transposase/invertase (TIGR01784 family)
MKSDSLFYTYFQILPEALLLLAGEHIDPETAAQYRFQSVEIKDLAFRLDGVLALPEFQGQYFFVEVQYQKDVHLYRRIFAEIMMFLHQNRPEGKWRVVVIFPKRSIDAGVPHDYEEYLASERLKIVYLNELASELLENFPLNLLQILAAKSTPDAVSEAARRVLTSPMNAEKRNDVVRLVRGIIAAKLPTITFEEIRAMIEPTFSELENTQYYRDIKAMEEQFLQRGLEKGQRRNQEATALRLLNSGATVEYTVEITGLTLEEVLALQH